MLLLLLQQIAILVTASVLLAVPGGALVSLLRVRAALPDTLAVPVAALFGALVACAATAVQLVFEQPVLVPVLVHVGLSVLLVALALRARRKRRAAGDEVVPVGRGWNRWTSGLVLVGALFTWLIRGAIRLDGLYHVALSRKLISLDAPNFNNVNRFADGGPNPAYALPGWHALVGWSGWLTHADPILSWEIMPVLVVALGALAAGGLARVLLADRRAEPLGALAWVLARILMARREVDGDAILFGAVPGQLLFEVVFPALFASLAVAMWTPDKRVLRTSLATMFACIVGIVAFHANYLPYVAFIGLGYAAWWLVSGPFGQGARRRLLLVGGAVAAMSIACMSVVLPILAQIPDFGDTDATRIDYHITTTHGLTHIRGGHLYEMLGMPGLLAILVAPIVAWRWRSRELFVASGGLLGLMTMCLVPPLFEVMRHTGSLTLGLRINHVVGSLLTVMLAGFMLLVADTITARGWPRRRVQIWSAVVLCVMIAAGMALGYDRFSPNLPGYLSWLAFGVLFLSLAVRRLRTRRAAAETTTTRAATPLAPAPGRLLVTVALVLTIGLALPVGAISARRAVLGRDPFTARTHQGDLKCLGGPVERRLRELPAGTIVLSDPVTSFRAMALAPVYDVGDYKVWNADQGDNRTIERLSAVNRFFDSSRSDAERLHMLQTEHVDYLLLNVQDGRWLTRGGHDDAATDALLALQSRLDRFADFQNYDGSTIVHLMQRNPDWFQRVALDHRAYRAALPQATSDDTSTCNSFGLWKVHVR